MCNPAPTLGQSIPRLDGVDDPLLRSVETLIDITQLRDRAQRVARLRDALGQAEGRSAVPLMLALGRRATIAAQTPGVLDRVAPSLLHPSAAVREVAARTMGAVLDADYLQQRPLRVAAAQALVAALDKAGSSLEVRIAALDAVGAAGQPAQEVKGVGEVLRVDVPVTTIAEQAARIRALGRAGTIGAADDLARIYEELPLDAPLILEEAAGRALVRVAANRAATGISARLGRKYDAGLQVATELTRLGELTHDVAAPALVAAFARPLDPQEKLAFAIAARQVADPQLVPALGALLDPRQLNVRWLATDTLLEIDNEDAASLLRLHLDEEPDLGRKLRAIALLGRHGSTDGYAFAVEHLSMPEVRDAAIDAVVATKTPRTVDDLTSIVRTSHDPTWNAAAIRALAKLGQADLTPTLLAIVDDLQNPQAPAALLALADLGEARAMPRVSAVLQSRSDVLLLAAIPAARRLLAAQAAGEDDVRDRLAERLADPLGSPPVREAALDALSALDDARLARSLRSAVRESALENTPLLARFEAELAKKRIPLELPAE
jgi:HEAT repeat protein